LGECEELSAQGWVRTLFRRTILAMRRWISTGKKRSNETHEPKTDPDSKMARKGKGEEAKLSYNRNLLVENRNGLIVNTEGFEANGTAERDAALVILAMGLKGLERRLVEGFLEQATDRS
jgi:hypothetical protein